MWVFLFGRFKAGQRNESRIQRDRDGEKQNGSYVHIEFQSDLDSSVGEYLFLLLFLAATLPPLLRAQAGKLKKETEKFQSVW